MRNLLFPLLFLSLLGVSDPLPAQNTSATRLQCQSWANQYQRLTELRRAGGTLAQMDRWRDRQRLIAGHMRAARCLQRFRISY